jgi:hypothetical protein
MLDRLKPTQQLALLGTVSGLLTTFVKVEAFVFRDISVLPGIFFGAVLAYGLYRWQTKNPLHLIGLVLLVIAAWYLAYLACILSHDFFKRTLGLNSVLTLAALGLLGGFIGSGITAFAVWVFARAFRDRAYWKRLVGFGTAAGLLLVLPEMGVDYGKASLLPLFVIWQSGVASIVARGITGLR